MNTQSIRFLLNEISLNSSRLEKERIIGEHIADIEFERVLKAAYSPFITYGVTGDAVKPNPALGRGVNFDDDTWELLRQLRFRIMTGSEAYSAVALEGRRLNYESAILLTCILNRDLRAGFTAGTVNRVKPGTIPVFEVMLAHKYEEKRIKAWPVAVEPKKDGVRVICIARLVEQPAGSTTARLYDVKFYSRTGKEFTSFDHLKATIGLMAAMNDLPSFVFDGEVVSGSFNKTVSEVRRKSEQASDAWFEVFDGFPLTEFEAGDVQHGYEVRRNHLRAIVETLKSVSVRTLPQVLAHSHEEIVSIYNDFRAQGFEGAIVKPLTGKYVKKRSHSWLKVKAEESEDLVVTGAFEGTGKYVGMLGGLIVKREHDRKMVEVKVGGGFSDAQRAEFWAAYLADLRKATISVAPGYAHLVAKELLGRMIEVEYHEITPDGSLRHPRFVRFRDDKQPELDLVA